MILKPPRPPTRKLVAHHNTFLAHPDVKVGDGSELLTTNGLYPKHDIYIGPGAGMTTTVEITPSIPRAFVKRTWTGRKSDYLSVGQWCICQVTLAGRTRDNPPAEILARRLLAE